MTVRKILTYPAAALKKVCAPIAKIDDEARSLLTDLVDTMRSSPGVGLAAPQIGILKRAIVVDVTPKNPGHGLLLIINPKIVEKCGEKMVREGCLSVPEYTANIMRAEEVTVRGTGEDGEAVVIESSGFEAVALQHEIDHLDGILFIDRIASVRALFKRAAREM